MCRMAVAPMGLPGQLLIDGFLRMSQGQNALNELNTELGKITHGDGWGAVYEQNGRPEVYRSVRPCCEDSSIESLRNKTIFLLHSRWASRGSVSFDNVHPFEYEIDGARWFFCHNGTVRNDLPIPATLTKPDPTDSERLFHLLLPSIREGHVLAGLRDALGRVRDYTCLNSFLLGADELWAVGLHTENPAYYTLALTETEVGPIVSSEPLLGLEAASSPIPNDTILRIDRRTGAIEAQAVS